LWVIEEWWGDGWIGWSNNCFPTRAQARDYRKRVLEPDCLFRIRKYKREGGKG
jgi:hypothetical protein